MMSIEGLCPCDGKVEGNRGEQGLEAAHCNLQGMLPLGARLATSQRMAASEMDLSRGSGWIM